MDPCRQKLPFYLLRIKTLTPQIFFQTFAVDHKKKTKMEFFLKSHPITGRKQIIFTAFWSKVLDFFNNWYIDSVCEDKALH